MVSDKSVMDLTEGVVQLSQALQEIMINVNKLEDRVLFLEGFVQGQQERITSDEKIMKELRARLE